MYFYRARWYLPEAGVFGERDPVGYADSPSYYISFQASLPNLRDPSGWSAVNEYRAYSEPLNMSFSFFQRLGAAGWLRSQEWGPALNDLRRKVKGRVDLGFFRNTANYAYWVPGDFAVTYDQALSSDWISNGWIRATGASAAGASGIGFILGRPIPFPSTVEVSRNDNISMQRIRMTQLNVMVYFLNAVGKYAKQEAVGYSPAWMWSGFQWGDEYVSKAVRLGTKFILERFNSFPMSPKWRAETLNAAIQALVVNAEWGPGSFSEVRRVLEYVKETIGDAPRIAGERKESLEVIGGVQKRYFRSYRVRLEGGGESSNIYYYQEEYPGVSIFNEMGPNEFVQ